MEFFPNNSCKSVEMCHPQTFSHKPETSQQKMFAGDGKYFVFYVLPRGYILLTFLLCLVY